MIREKDVEHLVRSFATGRISVQHECDPVGEAAQEVNMAWNDRRPQDRDDVFDPQLTGHNYIGVAFHQQRMALAKDGVLGQVQSVELFTLGE